MVVASIIRKKRFPYLYGLFGAMGFSTTLYDSSLAHTHGGFAIVSLASALFS